MRSEVGLLPTTLQAGSFPESSVPAMSFSDEALSNDVTGTVAEGTGISHYQGPQAGSSLSSLSAPVPLWHPVPIKPFPSVMKMCDPRIEQAFWKA